jgi:hypothetical protein
MVLQRKQRVKGDRYGGSVTPAHNTTRLELGLTYAVTNKDWFILLDATGNDITCTLPASPEDGDIFITKRIDNTGNTVTIDTADSATIDGDVSLTLTVNDSVTFCAHNKNWYVQ